MKITFDKDKIKQVLTAFNKFTNVTVTLFDSELNCLSDAGKWQPYCLAIAENAELLAKCAGCNRENAHIALNRRATYIYTCHAGIAEVVSPIFIDNIFIAYLMLGKFRDAEQKYSSKDAVVTTANQYGLDESKMLSAYNDLPILDSETIQATIVLLEMCIQYIAAEKHIRFDDQLPTRIEEYLCEHISERIVADDLCKKFYLSRRSLYAVFSKSFNNTVQGYITQKRIEKAKNLLKSTDLSINSIVYEIGFVDYNYFFKYFKKATGLTPYQYRKQSKLNKDLT